MTSHKKGRIPINSYHSILSKLSSNQSSEFIQSTWPLFWLAYIYVFFYCLHLDLQADWAIFITAVQISGTFESSTYSAFLEMLNLHLVFTPTQDSFLVHLELALLEWMKAQSPYLMGNLNPSLFCKKAFNNWMKNTNIPPASQVFYLIGGKVMMLTDIEASLLLRS